MATIDPIAITGPIATTDPIDGILSHYVEVTGNLISLLQEVQSHFGYLPKDALYYLAKKTGIPITRLYSIATFYHYFSLTPKGRHEIQVCTGTACHVNGSLPLLDELIRKLGIKLGETTPDMQFTLNEVHCVSLRALLRWLSWEIKPTARSAQKR